MKHNQTVQTVFLITLLALCGVLWGCSANETASAQQEVVSPTGCLKSQGRYYDPKVQQCVKVTDQHQANVLNSYRYVNQLADKDAGITEYSIYPKKYLTIEEAEILWADLRDKGGQMIVLSGQMPDNREYDPEPGWESEALSEYVGTPKVWGGGTMALSFGWWKIYDSPSDTIEGMILEKLKSLEKEKPQPQLRQAIIENRDYRVSLMHVSTDAKVIRDWWNRHLDAIEGIQPLVDTLDKNMPALGPVNKRTEGE